MANVQEAIRRLTIVADTKGVDKTTSQVKGLDQAYAGLTVESVKTEKATVSLENKLKSIERTYDKVARAEMTMAKVTRELNAIEAQGLITTTRKNELLALAAKRNAEAATATSAHARALATLNAQSRVVGGSILAGAGLGGGGAFIGVAAAAASLHLFIKNSIEAQRTLAQLEAVIKSTGGAAGFTADELSDMATALQRVTTYDDEAVVGAEALLLTFTRIGKNVFPDALKSILDLSTAMGQDLKSSAVQIGKALNDPIKGITALTRVGVTFTESQKDLIKSLSETGRVADAQKIILRELQTEFGGSAAAARDTLGGALSGLTNAFGDLFEVTSEGSRTLVKSINEFTATLSDPAVMKSIQDFGAAIFSVMSDAARDIAALIEEVRGLARIFDGVVTAIANTNLSPNFSQEQYYRSLLELSQDMNASELVRRKAAEEAEKIYAKLGVTGVSGFRSIEAASMAAYEATVKVPEAIKTIPPAAAEAGSAIKNAVDVPLPRLRPEIDKVSEGLAFAKDQAEGFAQSLIGGLMQGDSLAQSLAGSLQGLSSSLASGAISDLFSGNFVSAGIKGIGALVAGIFGDAAQEQADLEKARDAWRDMKDELRSFNELVGRSGGGALADALGDARDQFQKIAAAARDAGKDVSGLKSDFQDWQRDLRKGFRDTFDGMIKALKSGQGLDNDYAKGVEQAKALKQSLLEFVDDARTAFGKGSPEVAAAKAAARESALGILRGSGTSDPYLAEFNRLQGAAAVLRNTLRDLGLTAAEAGRVVGGELSAALAKLSAQFAGDLTKKINDLLGVGYKNSVTDLLSERSQLLTDSATLGGNPAQVEAYFRLAAQRIIDEAGLVGSAFDDLINQFPELGGVVHEFAGDMTDAINEIVRAQEELNRVGRSIADYLAELQGGSNSTLSPQDRLTAAQSAYQSQLGLAQGGDLTAQSTITQFADRLLDAARDFYASSPAFQAIFGQVQSDLVGLPAVQGSSDDSTQALIDALLPAIQATTTAVQGTTGAVTTGTTTVVGPTTNLATNALKVVLDTLANTMTTVSRTMTNVEFAIAAVMAAVNSLTKVIGATDGLGDRLDKRLKSIQEKQLTTANKLLANIANTKPPPKGKSGFFEYLVDIVDAVIPGSFAQGGIVGSYAPGGVVGNGIFNQDSVRARFAGGGDIMLAGGEGILNAAATSMIGPSVIDLINRTGRLPGNDNIAPAIMAQTRDLARVTMATNQALIAELRMLRAELADIKGSNNKIASATDRSDRPGKFREPQAA